MYPEEHLDEYEDNGTMVDSKEALANAVIGHRIINVEKITHDQYPWRDPKTVITLDNGQRVEMVGGGDCCAYTEVDAFLLHPEMVDHIITGVGTTNGYETWHIYADMGDVLELTVGWSPGNAFYYGYGFEIRVKETPWSTNADSTDSSP